MADAYELKKDLDQMQVRVMQDVALTIHAEMLKAPPQGSPVDTGWFRSNWIIGAGERPVVPFAKQKFKSEEDRKKEIGKAYALQLQSLRKLMTMTFAEKIWVSNHVPYAEALADGWSPQSPSGWVKKGIKRVLRRFGIRASVVSLHLRQE